MQINNRGHKGDKNNLIWACHTRCFIDPGNDPRASPATLSGLRGALTLLEWARLSALIESRHLNSQIQAKYEVS
jgi:hypothetical protein